MPRTLDGREWTIARWQRARGVFFPDDDVPTVMPVLEEVRLVATLALLGLVLFLLV